MVGGQLSKIDIISFVQLRTLEQNHLQLDISNTVFIHDLDCECRLVDQKPRLQFMDTFLNDLDPLLFRHVFLIVSIKNRADERTSVAMSSKFNF